MGYANCQHFPLQCEWFPSSRSYYYYNLHDIKLCGTNIGTTILLARVLQVWLERSASSNIFIDPKVRLGAIYALALGTNFGAFSFSFSASLAGLLWRDILRQKGIIVRQKQFALTNLPLIGTAIVVSGAVLIAEVNIVSN